MRMMEFSGLGRTFSVNVDKIVGILDMGTYCEIYTGEADKHWRVDNCTYSEIIDRLEELEKK